MQGQRLCLVALVWSLCGCGLCACGLPAEPGPITRDGAVRDSAAPDDAGVDGSAPDASVEAPCAAEGDSVCFYVATDGDDANDGSLAAPFQTFRAALELVGPGDIVYARGGTYGPDNAALAGTIRLPRATHAPPCAAGQTEADGFCQIPRYTYISLSGWHGYPLGADPYDIANGEAGRPITIRRFPGEIPVLDMDALALAPELEAVLRTRQKEAIAIARSHWVIRGFEVVGGNINMGGNIVDITIEGCHVHDLVRDGGDNPGLIRVNSGPEDVHILNNRLHDISDVDSPGVWAEGDAVDIQHFGAVTTLSGETYQTDQDTGAIEIRGNEIHNVPQAFFFKNASRGPIGIIDNHIHDSARIGGTISANIHFAGNLVHGVSTGFWRHGKGSPETTITDPDELAAVLAMDGHNLRVEYNTIVGLEDTLVWFFHGSEHVIRGNVIFGLPGTASAANWNSASFIKSWSGSIVRTVTASDNCLIVPNSDFQHLAIYRSDRVDHYDLGMSQTDFGLDLDATVFVSSNVAEAFAAPSAGDYALLPATGCGEVGHLHYPRP